MVIKMPADVCIIIDKLNKAGYEAFAVGGCIRDSILGRKPNDWDITTNALPMQIKEIFKRTIDTGIAHGTVTVMQNHIGYEITTYRIDGEYEDCRHPKQVEFTPKLREDLLRRDFTINAMAYNDTCGLVDIFGGMEDLENGIIRAVGDPMQRFTEDALRMMRAVRFSAQLGYEIEEDTKKAIQKLCPNLQKISAERIQAELVKTVTSPHPEHMRLLYETGITGIILPEFDKIMETGQNNPHHLYSVGEHTIHSMQSVREDKVLRLCMLFHDMGKPQTKTTDENGIDHFHGHAKVSEKIAAETLKRLKFDTDTIKKVTKLTALHDREIIPEPKYVKRALRDMGEELFLLLLEVKKADVMAQSDYKRQDKLDKLLQIKSVYDQVKAKEDCFCLKDLKLTGGDLIAAGFPKGPEMGRILNTLLEKVIEDPSLNNKETLLKMAKKV